MKLTPLLALLFTASIALAEAPKKPAEAPKPADEAKWRGPYLQKQVPLDPWGKAYVYRAPGQGGDFDLLSYGKDGQPGGEDDNADVSYR